MSNTRWCKRCGVIYVLMVKADDLLRLTVLKDGEIIAREAFDRLASLAITHDYVRQHKVALDVQRSCGRTNRR